MVLTQNLRSRFLSILRPWLQEDPFLDLKLGFLTSTVLAEDLLLDPSRLNSLIESSTRLMFKSIRIGDVSIRISPWSSPSVSIEVHRVEIVLSPREQTGGGRSVSVEELARMEMEEALAAMDPEGVAVHQMIVDTVFPGSSTSRVGLSLRDSLLRRLHVKLQDVCFKLELIEDSYCCLMRATELSLGSRVLGRNGLIGGFIREFFSPGREVLVGIGCSGLKVRLYGRESDYDKCIAFVENSCVGINLSGSRSPGYCVHIPRVQAGFTPSDIPILLATLYMFSSEGQTLSRSGKELWKLAAHRFHHLNYQPRCSLHKVFGVAVAWVRYVHAYESLLSFVQCHKVGVRTTPVNGLFGSRKCFDRASYDLNVVNELEMKLPPVSVVHARRIAQNRMQSQLHRCDMQWTESLRIIFLRRLLLLAGLLCKFVYFTLYWISQILLPFWSFLYFLGGKVMPSTPLLCFHLPSYTSPGCIMINLGEVDIRLSLCHVNGKEETLPMSANSNFLSFFVSVKSFIFTQRKDAQSTFLILGKCQVYSCSGPMTSGTAEPPYDVSCVDDLNSHVILRTEQAMHYSSGKASHSRKVSSGSCQQILENSSTRLFSDWDKMFSVLKIDHPEFNAHPFALLRIESLSDKTVTSDDNGILRCDLLVGMIHLSLSSYTMNMICLLTTGIWHHLSSIRQPDVTSNSAAIDGKPLEVSEELLDIFTTEMKMVMLDIVPKRCLHIVAAMGGIYLEMLVEQNGLLNDKGAKDDNFITRGEGHTFSVDLRTFEIAIWPASKKFMCNFVTDLGVEEFPEYIWLVEPRLTPPLQENKHSHFSSSTSIRHNAFFNFRNLLASWQISEGQKYPILGPASVTMSSSTSSDNYLSFCTSENDLSMALSGTAEAAAFLFIDELSILFQALNMYCTLFHSFGEEDSLIHQELAMKYMFPTSKNERVNGLIAEQKCGGVLLDKTSCITDISFGISSLDIFLGHSRKLNFTGKMIDTSSYGIFLHDIVDDMSDLSIRVCFQRSDIKISWDKLLLKVLFDFSGLESLIFKNESNDRPLRDMFTYDISESQVFDQLHNFSISASKLGFLACHNLKEQTSRNVEGCSSSNSIINSEMARPVNALSGGSLAQLFFDKKQFHSILNLDSWALLEMVLGDVTIMTNSMKNLGTTVYKPGEFEMLLCVSGKLPTINCEAQGGNVVLESSALSAFIQYYKLYSICMANLLSRLCYFSELSDGTAVHNTDLSNQLMAEGLTVSATAPERCKLKFLPAVSVNLSRWCLRLSADAGSGGISELEIELDSSLKLVDSCKKFSFDLSRLTVVSHHLHVGMDDHGCSHCTNNRPTPDFSSNGYFYGPLDKSAAAGCMPSLIDDNDCSDSLNQHNRKPQQSAFSESSSCNQVNCILAHLTASVIVEELVREEGFGRVGKNWVGNGFVAGFDITTTLDDIQMLLLLVSPFSDIPSMKVDNEWNNSSDLRNMEHNTLDYRIPDGAIVVIQDIHQHMYFAVEKVGINHRVVGALHYSIVGERALFKVRYHKQKRWWSPVSLFSLSSIHAKNDIGEPLRLNCCPGSSFVEVSSGNDKPWALWEAFNDKTGNDNDGGVHYDTYTRTAFHLVNSKNGSGVAFINGLPEFVKKPGNLFKMKVLHEYDLVPDITGFATNHLYSGSFLHCSSNATDVTGQTGGFKSLSITFDEVTWMILHKIPNAKDKFPIVRSSVSKFSIVFQIFPTKLRVLSALCATVYIFDAHKNLWRELIYPIDISIFFRSRSAPNKGNSLQGIPTRMYIGMKQIDVSLSELSVDVLLFFAERLNLVGPYAVKRSAIFANICKVENQSELNLICHFSNDDEVMVSGKHSASLALRSATTGNQISREELSVSLSFSEVGRLSTSPIQITLSREQFFAWRTRVTSLSDSRTFPGPFIVVEVSNKTEDGLSLAVSTLLCIHNESGFSLKLRFQRPDETDSESASVILRDGDTMDESRAAFDSFSFSGGLKRALTSLSLGNYLLSIKPELTGVFELGKKAGLVQWSDDLKGGKAVRASGIFDKLNYRVRKALRIESVKSFFSIVGCPIMVEGVHASDLYFLVHTIGRTVPVMPPLNSGDPSEPLAFQVRKEIYILPTMKVSNLLQSEIVVLLTENHPDDCVNDDCNNFGKEAKIIPGASASLYVNPAKIFITVTISILNSKCKPVNTGDSAKKLKEREVNHFDISLAFDGGRYSVFLRLCRGEQGILEATIFTPYTLHNSTEISILCFSDRLKVRSWEEEEKNIGDISPEFGVLLDPKSSKSWFLKSSKMHLKWFKENASSTFLDMDAISGVTEISLVTQTETGTTQIAKLGVSLAPNVPRQPVPSQLVNIVPRYVISNESRYCICVRQCFFEDDSDGMSIESKKRAAFYMQDYACKKRETGFFDSIFRKHLIGNEDCLVFIQFRVLDVQSSWSGPICIASLGRFCIKFKKIEKSTSSESSSSMVSNVESTEFAGVHVVDEGSSLVIHFNMPPNFALPYRIENYLQNVAVLCYQKESALPEMMAPGTSAGYVWDDQRLPHKLIVQIGGINMLREINIDKVRPWKPFFKIRKSRGLAGHFTHDSNSGFQITKDFDMKDVGFEVYTDGLTRILRICKFSESSLGEKIHAPRMSIQFRLSSLAVNFLESSIKDYSSVATTEYSALIVVRLMAIKADMVGTGQQKSSYVKVQSINVDEKWQGAPFASMIRRSEQPDCSSNENMLCFAIIVNTGSAKVLQVKYSSIVLQPIDLNIDEDTLMRLVRFWRSSIGSSGTPSSLFYFEHFEIHPIKIMASFIPGNQLSNYSSAQEALRSLLHNVVKVPTIKNASVELNGVLLTHALVTTKELLIKCAQHYSWYVLRAIYKAKGSQLLPPAFASIFEDAASSSLDVFFDPSDGSINLPGLTIGMFKFVSRCINSKGFPGSKRYLGDLSKTVKRVGSNAIFAAVTEISDSVLRGAETNGFNGLVTGFHQGLLHLAMEPARIGVAVMEGGPDRTIKLDRTPGIDEQYIEGYLQAMLDVTYKQDYLRVKVHDNQVFLKNLPPSTTLITEILEQVKSFLASKGLLIGDASTSSHPIHRPRGETDWKIGPTVLTLCEHLFVSFAIRALRSQTSRLVDGVKFIKRSNQEEEQAPSKESKQQPGRLWAVGRFALSGLLAYVDGRLCRHIPHPIARRIVSGFLLSFLEKKEGE